MWGAVREMYTLLHDSLLQLPPVPPPSDRNLLLSCKVITCGLDARGGHGATPLDMETGWGLGGIGFVSSSPALQSFPFNDDFGCVARWVNMLKIQQQNALTCAQGGIFLCA